MSRKFLSPRDQEQAGTCATSLRDAALDSHTGTAGVLGFGSLTAPPFFTSMADAIFDQFLLRQFEDARRLSEGSDLVRLTPVSGNPPNRYVAQLHCTGLARVQGEIVPWSRWAVGIFFPEDYLRRPHDVATLLAYLGEAEEPWHPNIRPPCLCVHVAPGAGVVEIAMALFDLLSWQTFSTADEGLNHAAAQWARRQDPARFPLERRPLRRRLASGSTDRQTAMSRS